MNPSHATSFRRMASGLLLLVAPALILLGAILDPVAGSGDDSRKIIGAFKDDPGAGQLSAALYILGFALMAIGIVGLVHVIRERGVALANIGGALAILGMIMLAVLSGMALSTINQAEHLDIGIATRLREDFEDYWAVNFVLGMALLGTLLGFILLAVAIVRSRVVHVAAAVLIVVGVLLVPFSMEGRAIAVIANLLLLAGWGLVGLKLLGMKDEEWAMPPGAPPANV